MKYYKFIQVNTDGSCVLSYLNPELLNASATEIISKFDERNFHLNQKIKKINYDYEKASKDKKKFLKQKEKF